MLIRRMRAVVVMSAACAGIAWVLSVVESLIIYGMDRATHTRGDGLVGTFASGSWLALVFGGGVGVLLALLLMVAERRSEVSALSRWRFKLWGAVAGGVVGAVSLGAANSGWTSTALKMSGIGVVCAALIGMWVADIILWMARRNHRAAF